MKVTGGSDDRTVAAVLVPVLCLLVFSVLVNTSIFARTGRFLLLAAPTIESVLILALVLVSTGTRGETADLRNGSSPRHRWVSRAAIGGAALLLATAVLFSAADGMIQYIWGRPFLLRVDAPMMRGLLWLVFGEIGELADRLVPWIIGLIVLSGAALSLVVLLPVQRVLRRRATRISWVVLVPALAVALAVGHPVTAVVVQALGATGELEFRDIGAGVTGAVGSNEPVEAVAPSEAVEPVVSLFDRDIHLFAVEAYGYAVFSRSDLFGMLQSDLQELSDTFRAEGYLVASTVMDSPVRGGFSWLAETTLLTGQVVDSQPRFEQLAERARESGIPSFSRTLHEAGYYTLMVKPGTVHGSWPEGWDIFRFERSLVAYDGDFNYRGPWFSYVAITDQHAIWTAHNYLQSARAPGGAAEGRLVFGYYQLVSSHTPFNRVPPYIPNWEDLGDGSVYNQRADQILTFNNTWGGGTQLDEGYSAAIGYSLRTISGYLQKHLSHEANPVIIVLGDHQAQRPIREQDAGPGVPIHIATRDPAIYEAFLREGFVPGMLSVPEPPHRHLAELYPLLLAVALR